jgi:transcriptional regulator with XRE-family HTH domain
MFDAAKRIESLLEQHGLKQADLCRMTGIETSLMSNYIKGKSSPKLSNAITISKAFGMSLDEFVLMARSEPQGQSSSSYRLNDNELTLVANYRNLNDEGQRSLLLESEKLATHPHYRRFLEGESTDDMEVGAS